MQTSRKLPTGWENYSPIGTRIDNTPFIAFKVPLKPTTCKRLSKPENKFTIEDLLDREPGLGLIIDLTFTYYYDPDFLRKNNIEYKKIFLRGRGELPRPKDVDLFFGAVKNFTEKSDKLIGVHCTHGVNRTGFMVCKYMIEELSYEPKAAIEAFEKARGHKIVRETYTECLLKKRRSVNRSDNNQNNERRVPKSVENRFQKYQRKSNDRRHRDRQRNDYFHQTNPSFMSFDGSNYIQQMTLNDYQHFPHAYGNQQFEQFNVSSHQYRGFYNSMSQTSSIYRYQANDRFRGREHLHGNQNYVRSQNYSYQPNQHFC